MQQKKCTIMECCKVFQTIVSLNSLIELLESTDSEVVKDFYLAKFKHLNTQFENYVQLIKHTIDEESLERGDPIIDHSFDETLTDLYENLSKTNYKAKKILASVANSLDLEEDKTIKLENNFVTGFQMKITRKYEHKIRGKNNFFIDSTKKDGVRFSNHDLQILSEEYINIRKEYEEQQQSILDSMMETVATFSEPLKELAEIYSHLDVIVAFACAANSSTNSYVKPKLLPKGSGKIKIKNVRHPCLEKQLNTYFIPNSIDFDKDNKKFYILTGPNMGGKSTFIRSIGICVVMAQIGSFVPADEAVISIIDSIFTRIGASDKQIKGISTFMAEMEETSLILQKASEDSLVIIDELGRGTSTYDGFGLAWSISEEISKNIKSYCLFATHFHELTSLGKEVLTIGNLYVSYAYNEKENELKMLYKVKEGVCDQKFGIHVAKMVDFPQEMIEYAIKKVKDFEDVENHNKQEQNIQVTNFIKGVVKNWKVDDLSEKDFINHLDKLRETVKTNFDIKI